MRGKKNELDTDIHVQYLEIVNEIETPFEGGKQWNQRKKFGKSLELGCTKGIDEQK